ncbi:crossover junction endodeoxyribonuclease RuvC [Fontisphaera persica]|uniref:crossover junction endodeoxyribonuclease RuvC n=1 Tax=Fontisphaera persica TaxID=2974023 RepID=UPI0024BFBD52|nr:crossover junction endodeoxyribonuclease RuvC [Fontisphaera persica]WCJ59637.1 crossover junction endodeoxyribonuclease RuvC [Fontisphaera persica]
MGIKPEQLSRMMERLQRPRKKPEPVVAATVAAPRSREGLVVLGVDPSLRGTGYGIVRSGKNGPAMVAHGTIRCGAAWPMTRCLGHIAQTLRQVVEETRPAVGVVEGLFYAQNLRTAIVMGQARGASLAVMAEAGLEVYEMAPRKVKQAIVGYGAAQKEAVARMVQRMLRLAELPAPDAADALALALAYLQETGRYLVAGPKQI